MIKMIKKIKIIKYIVLGMACILLSLPLNQSMSMMNLTNSLEASLLSSEKTLSPDQAFNLTFEKLDNELIMAHWKIANDYQLYKKSIRIEPKDHTQTNVGKIILPNGILKHDEILGNYEVYKNDLQIAIPIINLKNNLNSGGATALLKVSYQGCRSKTYCYPPITKIVKINLDKFSVTSVTSQPTSTPAAPAYSKVMQTGSSHVNGEHAHPILNQYMSLLQHHALWVVVLTFFGIGLLLAFTPCILPMLPILSGIILGHHQKNTLSTSKAFNLTFVYVLSMSLTYACAGLFAGYFGGTLQAKLQSPLVLSLFSLVFVLLALSLFGLFELQLPAFIRDRLNALNNRQRSGRYLGVAMMGCLSTLIVSPCVTAPMVGAITYISSTGNALAGGLILFTMGLGMGAPLLVVGTLGGKFLPKSGEWMNVIKIIFGILMMGMAVWLLSRILPIKITLLLTSALMMSAAIFIISFKKTAYHSLRVLWKSLAMIVFLYATMLGISAVMGNQSLFTPLAWHNDVNEADSNVSFKKIYNLAQLNAEIKQANKKHKPILLDFYADWCIACKEMDYSVFSNKEVKKSLSSFVLLRADVTSNTVDAQLLQKKYNVFAPPAIVFLNVSDKSFQNPKIDGAVNVKTFKKYLTKIIN